MRSKTQGFRYSRVTIDFYVTQQPLGNFLMGFFGKDTITGVGDPYTHTFAENDATPPSYTISNYDATLANTRAVTGAYLQKLSLNYAEKGLVMGQAVYLGKYTDVTHAKPTATYDAAPNYIPYQAALTLNSVSNAHLVGWKLDMDQDVQAVFGATGTQDVSAFSTGTITMTGEATFASVDNTELDFFRNNTQPPFSLLFTNTASHTWTVTMSKCAFKNATVIDQNGPYAKTVAKYEGVRNTTDAGPGTAVLLTAKSTAY